MTDIFDGNEPTGNITDPPKPPVVPDHLKELIGDGKKYVSVEKALESIPHAQSHIQKIEEENAKLREKMAEANAAEEVYKKLMESFKPGEGVTPPSTGLDEASVSALLERKLAENEAKKVAVANVSRVKDALIGKYGDKAQEIYQAKAQELGIGVDFLNEVVKRSPRAAEELFGIKPKEGSVSASTPGINTAALSNNRPVDPASAKVKDTSTDALVAAWRRAKPE